MDSDLPDSILWFIFNKLPLKDHVKTSILSKHWLREFKLSSTHLSFDLYNTLHNTTLPINIRLFRSLHSQFTSKLDQFMLNYQHATISSIRVNFPLGNKQRDVIDRLISQGIAKGVKHIELLLSNETNFKIQPYILSFTLLSNAADSLTYLHLEKCLLVVPKEFSGLKNLQTLVLKLIVSRPDLLDDLFSNCMHLEDFTLDNCDFYSLARINSRTLSRLKIVCRSQHLKTIYINAPNLSSFEYSCHGRHSINLHAGRLSQFIYRTKTMIGIVDMSSLKNLTTVVLDGFHQLPDLLFMQYLFEKCLKLEDVTLKNCPMPDDMEITSTKLLHLKIIDCSSASHSKITIDAENLSSFEYSGLTGEFSIKAPKLSKVFWNAVVREKNPDSLGPIPELLQIENLAIITRHSQISKLKVLGGFQNLRQLELFMDVADYPFIEFYSLLDVLMASQHLKKFSLTIQRTYWFGSLNERKCADFVHNELKYVELHGYVSTPHAIEFARSLLRNVSSLKKVTFSSMDKLYVGAETWTKGSDSFCEFNRNFIYESLKDEVKGQCELIIL